HPYTDSPSARDGWDAQAAAGVPTRSGLVQPAARGGPGSGIEAHLPVERTAAAKPDRSGELAVRPEESADRASVREPHLADAFRPGTRPDCGGFRNAGSDSDPPRAARLAGRVVRRVRLEREAAAQDDRHVGDVPRILGRDG